MRLLLAPSLAALVLTAPLFAAEQPAPAPAPAVTAAAPAIDASVPESAILLPARVLKDNDFKAFFLNLPADDQAKAKADWAKAQTKVDQPGAEVKGLAEVNQFLAQLLAPGAADALTAEAAPKLAEMKPQEISQGLQMMAGILPMMLQQKTGKPVDPSVAKEQQQWAAMLQGVLSDSAGWVLTAGINDQAKLKDAIGKLIEGAKALGVTDAKDLQKLPLEEFLARLSPLVAKAKAGLQVYDVQIDAFLASLTAKAQPGTGDERTLDVGFSAFGKAYTIPVHVTKKANHWVLSEKNGRTLGGMKQMMPGAGGGDEAMEPAVIEPVPAAGGAQPAGAAPAPEPVAIPITP